MSQFAFHTSPRRCWRLVLALAGMVLVVACGERDGETRLRQDLATALAADSSTPIDLAVSMPMPWTHVVVVQPYDTKAAIDEALGFPWNPRPVGRVMSNDDANGLLFVDQGRVRRAVVLRRSEAGFCSIDRPARFSRSAAHFHASGDRDHRCLQHVAARTGQQSLHPPGEVWSGAAAPARCCVPSMTLDQEVQVLWGVDRSDPSDPQGEERERIAEGRGVARPAGRRTGTGYQAGPARASGQWAAKLSRSRGTM